MITLGAVLGFASGAIVVYTKRSARIWRMLAGATAPFLLAVAAMFIENPTPLVAAFFVVWGFLYFSGAPFLDSRNTPGRASSDVNDPAQHN
jgi:ABC-type microcin C transport system permease subunit YejE